MNHSIIHHHCKTQNHREYLYDMPDTYNVDNFKACIDLRMGKITVDEYRKNIGLD